MKITILFVLILNFSLSYGLNRWPNHDISTLKLLQIVHRHGERSPTRFPPNDPYSKSSYWSAGIGELTPKGKYRMYKLGEFIRNEYNDYLGDKYSPREVYARSSLTDRCIESVSCLISGAYPPKQPNWEWNNGTDAQLGKVWQPFPIETFMPDEADLVLNEAYKCPAIDREFTRIFTQKTVIKFLEKNREFYQNISRAVGMTIDTLINATILHDTLQIEMDHQYYWNHTWTQEEEQKIVDQLAITHHFVFGYDSDSPIITRLRAGGVVRELNNNFKKVIDNQNNKKLYIYSTHDSIVGALLSALDIVTEIWPQFGSTLLFELHQKNNFNYFVRLFYLNEVEINTEFPQSLNWTDCANLTDCPLNQYFNSTQHLLYDDFDKECK